MSVIQRFTRDAASKYVWSLMVLAALIGLVYVVTRGWEAVEAERLASEERAVEHVDRVIEPRLTGPDLTAPLAGQSLGALQTAVERSILADGRVERVRIWSSDGVLLFSTERSDRRGSRAGLNDAVLREASRDGVLTRTGLSDTGGADDPERNLLRTYVPLPRDAVVEIDQTAEGTLGPVRDEWFNYQLLAGGAAILFLLLTLLSLREPIEPINVGVPFAASSVPAGYSLIDDDRLDAVEEVYRLASERVDRLKRKLAESEEARRRLEGDIQRTLTEAATGSRIRPPPEVPVPRAEPAAEVPVAEPAPVEPSPPSPATAAEPSEVIEVPDSEVVSTSSAGTRPGGPLARAARERTQPPSPLREEPAAARRKKSPKKSPKKSSKKSPTATPTEGRSGAPPDASAPEPVAEPAPDPAPDPAPPREVAAVGAKAAARTRSTAGDTESADAAAHEAALETFIRLTESDRQQHEGEVDQGEVRAALARTAARKKPGGEGLHRPESDRPAEHPGGPPPDPRA